MAVFAEKEIQRRQHYQHQRCEQYDFCLKRIALEVVLVRFEVAPHKKADTARDYQQHDNAVEIDMTAV